MWAELWRQSRRNKGYMNIYEPSYTENANHRSQPGATIDNSTYQFQVRASSRTVGSLCSDFGPSANYAQDVRPGQFNCNDFCSLQTIGVVQFYRRLSLHLIYLLIVPAVYTTRQSTPPTVHLQNGKPNASTREVLVLQFFNPTIFSRGKSAGAHYC